MRAYGQAGHAGPSDEHTPPRLPGAGVKWSEQITPAGVMPWSDTATYGERGRKCREGAPDGDVLSLRT